MNNLIWGILIGMAFAALGHFSFTDELDSQKNYCERVAEGTWPDYKGLVKSNKCLGNQTHGTH